MALERHKEVETSSKASGTRIGTQSEVLPALFNFMPCQPVVLPTENFDFTYIGVFRVWNRRKLKLVPGSSAVGILNFLWRQKQTSFYINNSIIKNPLITF